MQEMASKNLPATTRAERFDKVFSRLDLIASIPKDVSDGDPTVASKDGGTRFTNKKMIWGKAARFMIFSSDTKYYPGSKSLYSPSITVFTGDDGDYLHVKERNLPGDPNDPFIRDKIVEFERIEDLSEQFLTSRKPNLTADSRLDKLIGRRRIEQLFRWRFIGAKRQKG